MNTKTKHTPEDRLVVIYYFGAPGPDAVHHHITSALAAGREWKWDADHPEVKARFDARVEARRAADSADAKKRGWV